MMGWWSLWRVVDGLDLAVVSSVLLSIDGADMK